MRSKIVWTNQVKNFVDSHAPEPRRALWREIKALAQWDGRENPPQIKHLEDELSGYSRLASGRVRVIFFETTTNGQRTIECIYAAPRNTVYEVFRLLFLDELAS